MKYSTTKELILGVILVALFIAGYRYDHRPTPQPQPNSYVLVTISENGNLWNSAKKYLPAHMDWDEYAEEICVLNNIKGNTVYTGQEILVPVYNK